MIRFTPILLALLYGFAMYRFSVWQTLRRLDENSAELADPNLQPIFAKMAEALDVPRIKVHLYEIEPVNGLAAADGRVFITRGFYAKFLNGEITREELASVIAHELGHVSLGHSRRRMLDFSGQNAMRTALSMVLARFVPFAPQIAGALTSLIAARLSRQDEYEADAYASALMVKAGLGTQAQKSLFEKLETLTGARGASVPAWFTSHPKSADRIAAIEANEASWGLEK